MWIEVIWPFVGNILTIIGLLTLVWKASSVKSDMDEATKLQQKDIDSLLKNRDKVRDKLDACDLRLSNMDMVVAEINTSLWYMKESLVRIEKKI